MAPLTAAEKQKRYRDRMRQTNPEKYFNALKNNAERNRKYREKVKQNITEEAKNEQRLVWREKKREDRKKDLNNVLGEEQKIVVEQKSEKKKIYRMWIAKKAHYENRIQLLNKKVDRLRKQNARLQQKNALLEELLGQTAELEENIITLKTNENNMTPLSKSCSFVDQNLPNVTNEEKEKVKRVLLDHNILTNVVQDAYKNTKSNDERNIFKRMTENEFVRKYRMKQKVSLLLGLKGRARRKEYPNKRNKMIVAEIRQFFERDDVSRATSGKNEVKTFKKDKKQRRYLLKTLKDLFKKYKTEGGKAKYSTFKKHRPFYVLHPRLNNRDTCACTKHENFILKTDKLYALGMIDTKNVDNIIAKILCDPNSKDCAYKQCSTCRDKHLTFDWATHSKDEIVVWNEYAREKHVYFDKSSGNNKTTEKMVKKETSGTLISLTNLYNNDLNNFSKHVYNIKHQYSQYLFCINNLTPNEIAVHIDFSENYTCKFAKEVQTMHWGTSKPQITLHTGVIYAKDRQPETFASISSNNEHGPEAIWAHLTPVLNYIRQALPSVTGIHFYSDGPTSQYKQKKNFYLFSKLTVELGFPNSTWNFSEASHGKGAADGVGAAIKRRLDNCVAQGVDISNAETAYNVLQKSDSSVLTFYISEDSIKNYTVLEDLIPVPQTMTIHQVVKTESVNTIRYRCLSCFCGDVNTFKGSCSCLNIRSHLLYNERRPTDSQRKRNSSLETNSFEKKKKITKKTTKNEISISNKVQVLSDVRYLPENQGYIDLKKIDAYKFKIISEKSDLFRSKSNKTPDNVYKNPVPSTSKEGLITKTQSESLRRKRLRCSDESTDTDSENFSLHDSSDYCVEEDEEFLEHTRKFKQNQNTSKQQEDTMEHYQIVKIKNEEINITGHGNRIRDVKENNTKECNQREQIEGWEINIAPKNTIQIEQKDKKIMQHDQRVYIMEVENKTPADNQRIQIEEGEINIAYENMTQIEQEDNKTTQHDQKVQINEEEINKSMIVESGDEKYFKEGDSVIVKYYEKKSWRFYIGFIEDVQEEENITYCKIFFLKTVKNPLKFVKPKKLDRDLVPTTNIVKKVDLILSSGEYYIKNENVDTVYFN